MAAARHFNHRIFIVPEKVDEEIMVFQGEGNNSAMVERHTL